MCFGFRTYVAETPGGYSQTSPFVFAADRREFHPMSLNGDFIKASESPF